MRYHVTVLHNCGPGRFLGITEGDHFAEADSATVEAANLEAACELVFVLCNHDHPAELTGQLIEHVDFVRGYRARRNRSLSVADVLVVTAADRDPEAATRFLEVRPVGFTELPAALTWEKSHPGSRFSAAYWCSQNPTTRSR